VQLRAAREALDRLYVAAFALQRELEARKHRLAVDQHRAGAALAELAAVLGAGQMELLAQHLEQRLVGGEEHFLLLAVHAQRHAHLVHVSPLTR
jgi:hypothetical protein